MSNQLIESFNAKSRQQRRAIFNKMDTSHMRKRDPGIVQNGAGATFIFDDENDVCYVLRYFSDAPDELIAYTVEYAEAVLDWHIRAICDEYGVDYLQYESWRLWKAYVNAADYLVVKPFQHALHDAARLVLYDNLSPTTAARKMKVDVRFLERLLPELQEELRL